MPMNQLRPIINEVYEAARKNGLHLFVTVSYCEAFPHMVSNINYKLLTKLKAYELDMKGSWLNEEDQLIQDIEKSKQEPCHFTLDNLYVVVSHHIIRIR